MAPINNVLYYRMNPVFVKACPVPIPLRAFPLDTHKPKATRPQNIYYFNMPEESVPGVASLPSSVAAYFLHPFHFLLFSLMC
jgi:hypothetical protein